MATLKSTLRLDLIDGVSGPARRINGVLGDFQRRQMSMFAPMRGLIGQLAVFGAGYLGVTEGIRNTAGAAIRFEEAFANVRKVLNANDEQLANVRQSILNLSKDLPIAADGIAAIYAAAGQANIPIGELNQFAEMVAKVSTAWEVPVAETGQALAEIKNQLNLGVKEVGLFADSLNHLSNNTAANAPRLLEYTKRVAATGEMFGFSAQETLAFGGAMISAGAESEVAATSFRNMGRALTKGEQATKAQNTAFKRLGLDSVKTAKNMQKNALGTTLDVIEKIQKLPEWERISIASALFGDEARAMMPLLNNSTELRRQLALVGDEANYAGSAFKEYMVRASTVGNVLAILRNKIADVFRGIGDDMLPGIKEAALGIGDVIDTLGERASVFDDMKVAMRGFTQGLGYDGGIREAVEDMGDLLFGEADGSGAADRLGRVFADFERYGKAVRELSSAIRENPIAQFFGEMAGQGFKLMAGTFGILLFVGAIRKLASALLFLSGVSTALGILKAAGKLGGILGGAAVATTAATAGKTPPVEKAGLLALLGRYLPPAVAVANTGQSVWEMFSNFAAPFRSEEEKAAGQKSLDDTTKLIDEMREREGKPQRRDVWSDWLNSYRGGSGAETSVRPEQRGAMYDVDPRWANDTSVRPVQTPGGGSPATVEQMLNGLQSKPMALDSATISQILQPSRGEQLVRVVNKERPNVIVNAPVTISNISSPEQAVEAAASRLGQAVKSQVEAAHTD